MNNNNNEKVIDVLNTLVEINNDRIEGYQTASKEAEEPELKSLFTDLAQTSQRCKMELVNEIRSLGGKPEEGTKLSGKFYRAWMELKAALTGNDRKAILNSCEYGEDVAVDTYEKTLKNEREKISAHHEKMLSEQYRAIKSDHDKVKHLRDMAA